MSFELNGAESVGEGVLRVASEEVREARVELRHRGGSADEDPVHEARKHIKRARSLLRLGVGFIPGKVRKRESARLRDAARALSATRDRQVILRMIPRLTAEGWEEDGHLLCVAEKLRRELPGRAAERERLTPVAAELAEARKQLRRCEPRGDGFPARGLRRTYAAGRKAMRAAARDGAVSAFHEWRRRAKDLRHQLDFLAPIWPVALSALADDVHQLTDVLGRANDIELLLHSLEEMPQQDREELLRAPVVERLAERQRELWREALQAGARLYSDKPSVMVARMEACWDASRS